MTDRRSAGKVRVFAELHVEPFEPLTHSAAESGIMLTDTPREDDGIDPTHLRDEASCLLHKPPTIAPVMSAQRPARLCPEARCKN